MATQAQLAAVQQLYVGYLGRAADSAGQQFWANAIANGTATIASVATGFTLSAEYKAAYGGLTTDALVEKVYNNVLGRTPDAEGKAFWVAALASGKVTADTLVATIVTNLGALDQQTINNKVFVAQTYTDTVGANYTPAGGAAVLVGVTSDPTTVTAAIGNINNGTIPGQVVGLSLINADVAADAAVLAFAKSVAAANPTYDTNKDGSVTYAELTTAGTGVIAKLTADRGAIGADTATLKGNVVTADAKLDTAKAAVTATTATANATSALDSAVAGQATADQKSANVAAAAAAKAGVDSQYATFATGTTAQKAAWTALDNKLTTDTAITDSASLLSALSNPALTAADRATLVAEVKVQLGTYGADLVTAADQAAAYAKADAAAATAKTNLDSALVSSGAAADSTAAGVLSKAYTDAVAADKTAKDTLAKADTADKALAAAQAVKTQFDAVNKTASDAQAALDKAVDVGGALEGQVTDLTSKAADVTAITKAETFYFSAKDAAFDHAITGFGAGDSILLGSGYTFNSGALSSGNGNSLEFFFVKTATGTNVVVETAAAGSASATVDASGAVGTVTGQTDNVSVITLTGVSVDHLAVNNGVVSYVA